MLVVGAGLAGLAAAAAVARAGRSVVVVEASDGIGGRVRSDVIDGFTLDRGFQVVLTAYPELTRQFDVDALDLRAFEPGADVWTGTRSSTLSDPLRRLRTAPAAMLARVGTIGDKLRLAWLRIRLARAEPSALLRQRDETTADALARMGFTPGFVEEFWRPLVGGIQLDPDLATSRRMFDVVLRSLFVGDAAVPAAGMGAIPSQLARSLPAGTVRLGARVVAVDGTTARTDDGTRWSPGALVVATDGPSAARLLDLPSVGSLPAGCVWFSASEAPTTSRRIQLGWARKRPINVAVMSNVAPTYAPPGRHVVAIAFPGHVDDIERDALVAVREWWGQEVDGWDVLRADRITHGQPDQRPPFSPKRPVRLGGGRYVCGDHRDTASIQGALFSGRRCGEVVVADLASTGTQR